MCDIESRLSQMGVELPVAAAPAANYAPFVMSGGQLIVSGQLPMRGGAPAVVGRLGDALDVAAGQEAARLCAINVLAQVKTALGGDWSRLERCLKITGFVNAAPDFTQHPAVINGASDFLAEALGHAGVHARAAVGVSSLPFGVAVEVEALFSLR